MTPSSNAAPDRQLTKQICGAVVGFSRLGRPIIAEWYGQSGPLLYILSAIHGSERSAVTAGERFRTLLQSGLAERADIQIIFLPATNPDGIDLHTRHNNDDVDLNRNFPASNFAPGDGGLEPLSEPESVAIYASIQDLMPTAILSIHCCIPTMDWDGPAEELAQKMANTSGFPAEQLGAADGSLGSWAGVDLQIPTVTVEFCTQEEQETHDQLLLVEAAISAAAEWVHDEGVEPDQAITDRLDIIDTDDFSAFALGTSAGGLIIRAEIIGTDDEPALAVVSGAAGNHQRALFVAEHIRRVVHSEVYGLSNSVLLVTAANPDGISTMSSLNAAGVDVSYDFTRRQSPEAAVLTSQIDATDPELVIVVEATDLDDGVTLFGLDENLLAPVSDPSLAIHTGDDNALDETSFVGWLRSRDTSVVRLDVNTLFAVGDTREDETFDDIEVFSRTVLGLLALVV